MLKGVVLVSSLLFTLTFLGCYPNFYSTKTTPATLGPRTDTYKELTSLPEPQEKIIAAVYKFRDQTGQYKASQTGTSWSTAVTQGGTSILIKALEESNWFIPIEREALSELLNERKIIRSSRANYEGENTDNLPPLPPMLYAGVLLEGGIISYETNVVTGGAGLKYFNAGASNQYREDQVTVYLRVISTSNGRILKTVYTTKKILSQMVDVSLFRYVEFKRLLEVETGFSYNEPVQFAVTAAIEKAVQSLVLEGIIDSLWSTKSKDDINSLAVKKYKEEKKQLNEVDTYGDNITSARNKYGAGFTAGAQIYSGEYPNARYKPAGEIFGKISLKPGLFLTPSIGAGYIASDKVFDFMLVNMNVNLTYHIYPENDLSPFISFGIGVDRRSKNDIERRYSPLGMDEKYLFSVNGGTGIECMILKNLGLHFSINGKYFYSDDIDNYDSGKYNDYYFSGGAGLTFYF